MCQDGRLPRAHGPLRAPGDDLRVPGDGPGPLGEGLQRGGVSLGDDAQRGLRSKANYCSFFGRFMSCIEESGFFHRFLYILRYLISTECSNVFGDTQEVTKTEIPGHRNN